jgi:hypothetical protein
VYLKKGILLVLFIILLSFSVSAAANFSAQAGYDWLAKQSNSDGSFNSDVYLTSIATLTLDDAGYDMSDSQDYLLSRMDETSYCLASGACTMTETSATVLAYNELQDTTYFDAWEKYYAGALDNADIGGDWFLEIVTSSSGSCTLSYELGTEPKEIEIDVEAGSFPGCDGSNFLDLDKCVQSNLITSNPGILIDVDCNSLEGSAVLTLVYKSDSTYFIIANENSNTAEFQINNGCFGKTAGSSCNQDASLWSGWALSYLDTDINTLIYLKEKYDKSKPKQIALMYLATKDDSYLADLADIQKSDGSFDRNVFTTGLAVLALKDSSDYTKNVDNAKSFLRDEQDDEGHWIESIEATAMALYGAFSEEDITPGKISGNDATVSIDECETDSDCELLYGSNYECSYGSCETVSVENSGCVTDEDCSSKEACIDDVCIESECNNDGKTCEYPAYNENAYNCPSDCWCGDGICDDYEQTNGCSSDCGEEEEEEEEIETLTSTTTTSTKDSQDSGNLGTIIFIIVLLLVIVGGGIGGYFAYKKGMLDSILSKFKKGGSSPPSSTGPTGNYKPFSSRLPPGQSLPPHPRQGLPPQQGLPPRPGLPQ